MSSVKTDREDRPQTRKLRRSEAGFSLIEIMVAVLIMAIMATVVTRQVMENLNSANIRKARIDVETLSQTLQHYRLDTGQYPSADEGLEALIERPLSLPDNTRYPPGGYLGKPVLPKDPWGNDYVYIYPGEHGVFDIYSMGADGRPGGEDNDADIVSWEF